MYNSVEMTKTTYEIWDIDTVNVIGDYSTQAAACAYVRRILFQYGRDAVDTWELVRVPGDGDAETIAVGGQLADLADGPVPAQ